MMIWICAVHCQDHLQLTNIMHLYTYGYIKQAVGATCINR